MTEVERIMKDGRFKADFFDPQTICDFYVDKNLKKIWAVELDLLSEFDRVCKKYKLRYCAFGGTILGAVRHSGFIPWDDDIDVAMPMEDYKHLQTIASEEFQYPYKLQTPYLDPGSFFSFMKLRNGNTTFTSEVLCAQTFNQGAFIDIFPLVECPPDKLKQQRDRIFPSIMRCSNYMKRGCEDMLTPIQKERFDKYFTDNPLSEYEKVMAELDNDEYKGCGYYTHASLFFNYDDYYYWERKLWDEYIDVPFENAIIPIPIGWNEILLEYYGNYKEFPPIEKRISNHSGMIIDMDKPYTEYIRKKL